MKKNFKKLAILSIVTSSLFAFHKTFAMREDKPIRPLTQFNLMVVCKYLNSAQDYTNLVKTCKEYMKILDISNKNYVPLTEKELEFFPNIDTYYVYGTRSDEYKPRSFTGSIKKIVYKSGSFDVQTIIDVMNNGKNRRTIKRENLENKSSNVDFNIVCEFANGKTIEFEVRLGELATNKRGSLSISVGIGAYNRFADFSGQNHITRADIEEFNCSEGVTEIGDIDFWGCIYLKTINIPNSVKRIGDRAFCRCINLRNMTLGESIERICSNAFADCPNLKNIIYKGKKYDGYGICKVVPTYRPGGVGDGDCSNAPIWDD